MSHLILLGDSIFDNAAYVPGEPAVIEQLGEALGAGWTAELRAVDGSVTRDVLAQLDGLPDTATHLVLSSGGNDALAQVPGLDAPARNVLEALDVLARMQASFRADYRALLARAAATGRQVRVCTIYDAVPGLPPGLKAALSLYNDVIVCEAARFGLACLDLRLVCTAPEDFSGLSPIEPSSRGGRKIARAIVEALQGVRDGG